MNYESRIDSSSEHSPTFANPLDGVDEEDRRSRKRTIIIIVVMMMIAIATWFVLHRPSKDVAADSKDQVPTVSVITPGAATVQGLINANGSLAARRELPVGAVGEGGQVRSVLVEAGQWVHAGQVPREWRRRG